MVRAVLIWLLVLALPAQGALAATMAFCGPTHHERAAVSRDAGAALQAHDAASYEHHGSAAQGHATATATDQATAPDLHAVADLQKCSVCAACCSSAVIHDMAPKLPALDTASAPVAALAPPLEPFAADGPDRPPRHPLA